METPLSQSLRRSGSQHTADAGEGLSGSHRVVRVGDPFGEGARLVRGHLYRALAGAAVTDQLAGPRLGTFGQLFGGGEVAGGVRDDDAELRGRLEAGCGAVARDHVARGLQVLRRVDGADLRTVWALQLPLGQPGERTGGGQLDDPRHAELGERPA